MGVKRKNEQAAAESLGKRSQIYKKMLQRAQLPESVVNHLPEVQAAEKYELGRQVSLANQMWYWKKEGNSPIFFQFDRALVCFVG